MIRYVTFRFEQTYLVETIGLIQVDTSANGYALSGVMTTTPTLHCPTSSPEPISSHRRPRRVRVGSQTGVVPHTAPQVR